MTQDKHIARMSDAPRLLDWLKTRSVDGILKIKEVRAMTDRLRAEDRNFREALQSFHFTYLATIFEAPNGGNGPGRLDYYLWPYLESDLADGTETPESVRELVDELFIRFHERLCFGADGWCEQQVHIRAHRAHR
jgi:pyruvate-formate lyase